MLRRRNLINTVLVSIALAVVASAQTTRERTYSRADFINVDGGSLTDRIGRAARQFKDSRAGDSVWLIYHFPVNESLSIGPFSGTVYRDGDGIRLERRDDPQGASVVLLADTTGSQPVVTRVTTLNLTEPYVFENRPVYWLGNIDGSESITYLETVLRSQPADKGLVRGALRAIGAHTGNRVVPLLKGFAEKETVEELQRSAISNLGRVGSSESIDALISIFDSNVSGAVKDEVISALARQKERRAADKLLAIAKNDADPKLRQAAIRRLSTRQGSFAVNWR